MAKKGRETSKLLRTVVNKNFVSGVSWLFMGVGTLAMGTDEVTVVSEAEDIWCSPLGRRWF